MGLLWVGTVNMNIKGLVGGRLPNKLCLKDIVLPNKNTHLGQPK